MSEWPEEVTALWIALPLIWSTHPQRTESSIRIRRKSRQSRVINWNINHPIDWTFSPRLVHNRHAIGQTFIVISAHITSFWAPTLNHPPRCLNDRQFNIIHWEKYEQLTAKLPSTSVHDKRYGLVGGWNGWCRWWFTKIQLSRPARSDSTDTTTTSQICIVLIRFPLKLKSHTTKISEHPERRTSNTVPLIKSLSMCEIQFLNTRQNGRYFAGWWDGEWDDNIEACTSILPSTPFSGCLQ